MTVSSETNRKEYAGDDSTTGFPTTFNFALDGDLKVTLVDSAGTETVQTITTHYTVTGAGDDTGGTVTMITPPATGEELVIERDVAYTQGIDYIANDDFPAETHEGGLDKLTYLAQQLKTSIARVLRLPSGETDSAVDMELPVATSGYLDKILGFDSAGKAKLYTQNELSAAATIITNKSVDQFTFGGATTVANLSTSPASENNTQVFHDGVYQEKTLYSLSGTTLTFAAAPGAGTVEVVYGAAIDIGTPSDGTVIEAKIAANAVTPSKLADDVNTYVKGADIASASALALGSDGSYFDVTGTTGITSIGTRRIGALVRLHFDAVLILTHHATDLVLPGAANIITAAGDEAVFYEYATGDWRCVAFLRAGQEKLYPGDIVQVVYVQDGAVATGTTVIPNDDTIPQNTEGDEYMTLAITPKNVANILKVEVTGIFANSVINDISAALFQDTTVGALAVAVVSKGTVNHAAQLQITYFMVAGTVSTTTFKIRAGGNSAGTLTFNGQSAARKGGGVMASLMTITEIKV